MTGLLDRRALLAGAAAGAGSLLLGGCGRIYDSPSLRELLAGGEGLTQRAHRALMGRDALANTDPPTSRATSVPTAPRTPRACRPAIWT